MQHICEESREGSATRKIANDEETNTECVYWNVESETTGIDFMLGSCDCVATGMGEGSEPAGTGNYGSRSVLCLNL